MKQSFTVFGMLFGDEAKGATVDALARKYKANLVIRYSGGPQTAHNVVEPSGRHHTFRLFGSGTFAGAKTHLTEDVLINPIALEIEADLLERWGVKNPFKLMTIDNDCVVITPFHRAINRLQELKRKEQAHGSCGIGLGIAREFNLKHKNKPEDQTIYARDLSNLRTLVEKLQYIEEFYKDLANELAESIEPNEDVAQELKLFDGGSYRSWIAKRYYQFAQHNFDLIVSGKDHLPYLLNDNDVVIFEGSQGMLLDQTHGYQPHVTWTDLTHTNVDKIINAQGWVQPTRIGCIRPYLHRHGAGPLPHEDEALKYELQEIHNTYYKYAGEFRYGYLDIDLIRQVHKQIAAADYLSISCLDQAAKLDPLFVYDLNTRITLSENNLVGFTVKLTRFMEARLGIPFGMLGYGQTFEDRDILLPGCNRKSWE